MTPPQQLAADMPVVMPFAVDIVIPVHNEADCLRECVRTLIADYAGLFESTRFVVVENGSTDSTWDVLSEMTSDDVLPRRSAVADYGAALREGLSACSSEYVLLGEVDFCEVGFAARAAAALLSGASLVQSSKACEGAADRRPPIRRLITWGFNRTLRLMFGFSGTDTHGMKMARRETLQHLVSACVLDGNLLATEMVLRARKAGLEIVEIPVTIEERRATSIGILRRIPSTLRDLARLRTAIKRGT